MKIRERGILDTRRGGLFTLRPPESDVSSPLNSIEDQKGLRVDVKGLTSETLDNYALNSLRLHLLDQEIPALSAKHVSVSISLQSNYVAGGCDNTTLLGLNLGD